MTDCTTSVFIIYSHDSPAHSRKVLEFSNKLRELGVDVELDQYHPRPAQGWPKWCEENLHPKKSQFVLMVCTQVYLDRINGEVKADEGRGVYWEGALVRNYIYDAKANSRFVPILFPDSNESHVPMPLKGYGFYKIQSFCLEDEGFIQTYRLLTNQPRVKKPLRGEIVALGSDELDVEILTAVEKRNIKTEFKGNENPKLNPQ